MKNAYPERNRLRGPVAVLAASLLLTPALFFGAGAGQEQEQDTGQTVSQPANGERQTHGPTTSSDTLWLIANRYHPDRSVSVYQTMVAFMEKNPHAFPNNNIHELLRGVHLHVPTLAEVREVDLASATQSMVEALGGLPSPRLNAQMRTLQADLEAKYEAQINQLREELETAQADAEDFSARNSELNTRLRDLERTLEQLRADLADANAKEQALLQQYAELERAQLQREQASAGQARPTANQRPMVADAWWHRDYIVYALAAITLFFIFFSLMLMRRQSRAAKAVPASPYELAAFKKIEAELDDIAAVEAANAEKEAAATVDDAEADAETGADNTQAADKDVDAETAAEALADAAEAEVEFLTREDAASDEAASEEEQAPAPKPVFRDIDEIIEEAEADADDDSDEDEGQTEEEAVRHQREQLAAQLDLARAYIEMEEYDEAESAIMNVLEGSDESLRDEAAELLKRLKKDD